MKTRFLCCLAIASLTALSIANADETQSTRPGIDTLPPLVVQAATGCGVRTVEITETRNFPDPPAQQPGERDQIDRGIAGIRFAPVPSPLNARLVLVTDTEFPQDPAYTRFTVRVEAIDKSREARAVLEVRDFGSNVRTQEIVIPPSTPTMSTQLLSVGMIPVGNVETKAVSVTNLTGAPTMITGVRLARASAFSILDGGTPPNIPLNVGESHTVLVRYTPTLASEGGDIDTVIVDTDCGSSTTALNGVGGVMRIIVEDWNAGQRDRDDRICKTGGLFVENTGNSDLVITAIDLSSADFTLTPTSVPVTVTPNSRVSLGDVCFEARVVGVATADVVVVSNANDGDSRGVLSGEVAITSVDDVSDMPGVDVHRDADGETFVFMNPTDKTLRITITDIVGRTITTHSLPPSTLRLSSRSWPTGTALITIDGGRIPRTLTTTISR